MDLWTWKPLSYLKAEEDGAKNVHLDKKKFTGLLMSSGIRPTLSCSFLEARLQTAGSTCRLPFPADLPDRDTEPGALGNYRSSHMIHRHYQISIA